MITESKQNGAGKIS